MGDQQLALPEVSSLSVGAHECMWHWPPCHGCASPYITPRYVPLHVTPCQVPSPHVTPHHVAFMSPRAMCHPSMSLHTRCQASQGTRGPSGVSPTQALCWGLSLLTKDRSGGPLGSSRFTQVITSTRGTGGGCSLRKGLPPSPLQTPGDLSRRASAVHIRLSRPWGVPHSRWPGALRSLPTAHGACTQPQPGCGIQNPSQEKAVLERPGPSRTHWADEAPPS